MGARSRQQRPRSQGEDLVTAEKDDLAAALQTGAYLQGPYLATAPELSSVALLVIAVGLLVGSGGGVFDQEDIVTTLQTGDGLHGPLHWGSKR
jgi:hypothetical protein